MAIDGSGIALLSGASYVSFNSVAYLVARDLVRRESVSKEYLDNAMVQMEIPTLFGYQITPALLPGLYLALKDEIARREKE